ncbi:acyltransferase, putative [Mycobacterium bohemicum DSM 44277]|uniref:Acyltransferase n=2 Tax=Mycobacterium bohemicum TaxID=56425 RepID=A0A1X1RE65_MYCBE|nr:acyltransferase [Mycobacterium bohemicum]MCV6968804.1 acyltransferase [Mycobacterium bohemicum]ORV03886.1 acyltransferase [Mycobacterium bohemicum]CPR09767.1 acyltransferase, putative [Mycobacterium bohemicum DSM 44277]
MTLSEDQEEDAQGGLEQTAHVDRVAALTGIRAVAALLVVGTHAAYTTGKYTHGYWGLVGARLEIGVPIFFVLSGFLLFRPWVKSAATGGPPPSLSRYARHRFRRIMPAYVITVLFAYVLYHFRQAGPNPGHTWLGLVRNLTLTQIYCNGYLGKYLHQGLTQMWSLAVEAAFYVALPLLAYLLLVLICRRRWQPRLMLAALAGLTLISPAWLVLVHADHWFPDGARLWLPTYLAWFLGGMMLAVLQGMGVRAYAFVAIPLAVICYFIVSTPIAGAPTTSPASLSEALYKTCFYAVIATLAVAPLALGDHGWYYQLLATRPMVWLGEISYEIFLIHLITMEFAMVYVVRAHVYTGSMLYLFVATLVLTIPLAWLLHRFTRVRD